MNVISNTGPIIALAKLIASVTECLKALRSKGYWLSDEIIAVAIYEAGEEKV